MIDIISMVRNAAWVIWSATCLLTSAPAVSCESLLAIVRSCAAESDDSARLQCYDRAVDQFKGVDNVDSDPGCSNHGAARRTAGSKSASAAPAATTPADTNMSDRFGLTSGQILSREPTALQRSQPKRLTARIVSVTLRQGGYIVVRLDNDQVWEQTEAGPDLRIAAGDEVTVDRGMLGAYWLSGHSRRLAIKVRRTQ